ncbi:MAG: alpha/beta hydrolase [Actinobacteria bacterium]|nr:alpha/beta hydrolase [Actinomycetota bacterium]
MPSLHHVDYRGHRVAYEVHGEGPRVLVFTHGLLLDAALNRAIAQRLARAGHRVVLPELLGHGRSDKPRHAYEHRLDFYAEQVVAILDDLGLDEAVVGGVSLGANVALEVAATAPERVRAMVLEMPVLERGAMAAVQAFWPALVSLRYLSKVIRPFSRLVRALPRTGVGAFDSWMNLLSADPRENAAVLHGLMVGPGAPAARVRFTMPQPALVIGHGWDLLHAMDDARALAEELPNARFLQARSILEARTAPSRIVGEIDAFCNEVWGPRLATATTA